MFAAELQVRLGRRGGGSGLLSHWSIASDSALWELFVYYSVETSWDVFLANLIVNKEYFMFVKYQI